jgi:sucrose-6-phosphate hydrolase SacC (GH32 family)
VHWKQLAHAIEPYDGGDIWSGSAVVDHANTSGFAPAGDSALVAAFTHARKPFGQAMPTALTAASWTLNKGATSCQTRHQADERDPRYSGMPSPAG